MGNSTSIWVILIKIIHIICEFQNSNILIVLIIKWESNDSNKVYSNIFSLENIILINKYFKQFDSLNNCKKLEYLIHTNNFNIEIINIIINLYIIYNDRKLLLQDPTTAIHYRMSLISSFFMKIRIFDVSWLTCYIIIIYI